MISLRFARVGKFFGALSIAGILVFVAGPPALAASSARAKAKKPVSGAAKSALEKPASASSEAGSVAPGAVENPPEFADAWPTDRLAAQDLELRSEGLRKADALVAFGEAVLAEDGADSEKSLAGYRRVLAVDPGYAELAVKVAYELARSNDIAGGIQVLKDSIKAAPTEPLPLIYLSQLYAKYLKKTDLALKYAEQALALAPDNFASYLANFELHLASGDQRKAEAILERAAKVNTSDAKYLAQVGDLYTRLYLKEDGSAKPEEREKMNALYRKAAELAGADATIFSKVGDYFVLSQQVKEAIPYYLKVIEAPSSETETLLANTREKLARAFLVVEQRDEAIATLEKMAKENPLRFDTFELLGELYEKKGEVDKALTNYQHSLLLDPTQPENYVRLAYLQMNAKQPDQAVVTMQQARQRFSGFPQLTILHGVALSQAKRHAEAMTAFAEAAADAEHNHEELLNAGFYMQYAAAAEQAGLTEKAAELLKRSIELDPSQAAQAYNFLGYMWADRGEHLDEAIELIEKAVAMDPDNGAYLDSLGWVHFKRGEPERALKELHRALEVTKPEDPVVYDHLADTYYALGRIPEALQHWQKALLLSVEDKKLAVKIGEKIEAAKQKVTSTIPAAGEKAATLPQN